MSCRPSHPHAAQNTRSVSERGSSAGVGASLRLFALCAVVAGGVALLKGAGLIDGAVSLWESPAIAAPAEPVRDAATASGDGAEAAEADEAAPQTAPAESCPAVSLADRSGLTHAELRVLESLSQRRRALEAREAELDSQTALLQAAEARIEARVAEIKDLRTEVERLLGQLDVAEQEQVESLVTLYSTMKAKDAARILPGLSSDVRLAVAAQMDERALSSILAAMAQDEAVALTMLLARRHDIPDTLDASLGQD